MKTVVPFLSILALSLAAGLGAAACQKTVSITDFDTSCQKNSDCTAVYVGPPECCSVVNAAINVSDKARYDAEIAAQGQGSVCNVACVFVAGSTPVPVCNAGTCALTFVDAGAPVDCGGTPCIGNEICVSEAVVGGAVMLPDDAGACPAGEQKVGSVCQRLPAYHCAPPPAGCTGGLSCACAQTSCAAGYTCQQASAGLVQCVEAVP